jgi:ABC-2 type transport system permease protein
MSSRRRAEVRKIAAVARKEFRQIARDPRTLMTLLFVPAFVLLLYGYALNFDIRHIRLGVDDRDRTPESRSLVSAFVNSGYFDLIASVDAGPKNAVAPDRPTATELMDRNDVRAVLVIPSGLGRDVRVGHPVAVQVLLNGDNANTATTVMSYAVTIIRTEAARYAAQPAAASAPIVTIEPRVWYNPQLRSALFLVPGLIAYISMISAVVSTALSIVREKERGTMEQVRMAPLGGSTFVVGKVIPYFAISLLSAIGVVVASMILFDLPMRGSWMLLFAALSLFLVGALGLGLVISSVAETQQVAFQLALLASFLPTLMLSGFIFPISSMPRALQVITYVVPARYFLIALRSIVLKGTGPGAYAIELGALTAFAIAVLTLASVRLRRQWT